MTIRRKLLLLFLGLGTLPMIGISVLAYYRSVDALLRTLTDQTQAIVHDVLSQIRTSLAEPTQALGALAEMPALVSLAADSTCPEPAGRAVAAEVLHPCAAGRAALADFYLAYRDSFSLIFLVPAGAALATDGRPAPPDGSQEFRVRLRAQAIVEQGGARWAYLEPWPELVVKADEVRALWDAGPHGVYRSPLRVAASGFGQRVGILLSPGEATRRAAPAWRGALFGDLKVSALLERAGRAQPLGRLGDLVVVSADGVVLFHPDPARINQRVELTLPALASIVRSFTSRDPVTTSYRETDGTAWLVSAATAPDFGWFVGFATPIGAFVRQPARAAAVNLAVALLSALFGFGALLSLISRIWRTVQGLTEGAEALAAGHLETRIEVRASDEVGRLAGQFNRMAEALAVLMEERLRDERLREELRIGGQLQARVLPTRFPDLNGASIFGTTRPAVEIGGDYFDVVCLDAGTVDLAIGDVSGKGLPAGLVMVQASSIVRALSMARMPLRNVMETLCRLLAPRLAPNVFMSLVLARLDPARRHLAFAGAGHEHLLVYRAATREVEAVRTGGTAIGIVPAAEFRVSAGELLLDPGDRVLFYTDGVVERRNRAGEFYGLGRLTEALRGVAEQPVAEAVGCLLGEVDAFAAPLAPQDDLTLVLIGTEAAISG